ncbi:MAG: gene transfer agent family protein [Hyphomonas sp.]|nr:gene transfer agent family protein [Hyphomonas sp.]
MNTTRGERLLMVDGKPLTVCLTLGALAELEQALGCTSLADLQARLKCLSASELKRVLKILIRGDVTETSLESVSPRDAARAVAEAFCAALG